MMPGEQAAVAHAIEIESSPVDASKEDPTLYHRWRCSCGAPPGDWKTRAFQARQGASKHVAIAAKKTLDSADGLPYTGRPRAKEKT